LNEVFKRDLPKALEFLTELIPVSVNRVACSVFTRGEFDAGDDTIKCALARKGHGHSQQFVRDSHAAADWTRHRLPIHEVGGAQNRVLRIHRAHRQRHL